MALDEGLSPVVSPQVLESLERPVPDILRSRFRLTMAEGPSLEGRLIFHHPGRLRMEILNPLGTPELSIVATGEQLVILDHTERVRLSVGDGSNTEVAEELALWTEVLTGQVPALPSAVLWEDADSTRFVAEGAFGLRMDITLAPTERTPRLIDLSIGRTHLLTASYGPFVNLNGSLLPERVDVTALNVVLSIQVTRWEQPGSLPAKAFSAEAPDDYIDRTLEEDTAALAVSTVLSALSERGEDRSGSQ